MTNRKKNFVSITLVENFFQFFSPINDIFGVAFFYTQWNNIFLALLPWIITHYTYSLLVPRFTKYVGKIGIRQSLQIAIITIALSAIPAYLYSINPTTILLITWWIVTNLFRFTYHPARVYLLGRCTTHKHRGSQIGFRRISFVLTKVVSPITAGLIIHQYGFPLMLVAYSLVMLLALIPTSYLPNMYFKVDYNFSYWMKKYRFQRLTYYNLIASLGTYSNHLWMLFIFLALSGSYQTLGGLVTTTTMITMLLVYFFGYFLDKHSRKKSLRSMFYLSSLALFTRSIPFIPFSISDTFSRLTRFLKQEVQDVFVYDTLNDYVKPHLRDEAVIFEEFSIDFTIASVFLILALTASVVGIPATFVVISIVIFLLNFFNPYGQRASLQPNP